MAKKELDIMIWAPDIIENLKKQICKYNYKRCSLEKRCKFLFFDYFNFKKGGE